MGQNSSGGQQSIPMKPAGALWAWCRQDAQNVYSRQQSIAGLLCVRLQPITANPVHKLSLQNSQMGIYVLSWAYGCEHISSIHLFPRHSLSTWCKPTPSLGSRETSGMLRRRASSSEGDRKQTKSQCLVTKALAASLALLKR